MRASAAIGLLLAGCGGSEAAPTIATAPLQGEWLVAAIDGQPPSQGWAIGLSVGPDRIDAASTCVAWGWHYRLDGTAFAAEPVVGEPVCSRALTRDERAFQTLVGSASTVRLAEDGRATLRGADGTLKLARP